MMAVAGAAVTSPPALASPDEHYSGPYFGDGNFPPGCIRDWSVKNPANTCFHMKTGLNALDSPKIDVLVLVPTSPAAERDMRIARQAIEMWEGGIDYLAPQMGMRWLSDGVEFHVTVDHFDPLGGQGGEFTTYPVVDPEIVVIVNQPGPAGIGVDPGTYMGTVVKSPEKGTVERLADGVAQYTESLVGGPDLPAPSGLVVLDANGVPCYNVQNPFDFEYWEKVPGFDSHHDARSGTYVEQCGGAGGNVCFSVNGGVDPLPERFDFKNMFELVAHETGHCMSLGHVGDGGEAINPLNRVIWGPVPYSDIMSYSEFPSRASTCVSTLDVESFAIRMSNYLDVNGDGTVGPSDRLLANDQVGQGNNPFQVQHPDDYLHASGTGSVFDCPQPDLGIVPGAARTDWTPEPVDTVDHHLHISSPADGVVSDDGHFDVAGRVERRAHTKEMDRAAATDDPRGDATNPLTDVVGLDVNLTDTEVHAKLHLAEMVATTAANPVGYAINVNGSITTTYQREGRPFDSGAAKSTWDPVNKTVEFRVPRSALGGHEFDGAFRVRGSAYPIPANVVFDDDIVPDGGQVLVVGDPVEPCGGCTDGDGPATGQVHVYVDDVHAGAHGVDTSNGSDSYSIPVVLPEGTHVLRVEWEDGGRVVAGTSVTVTHNTDDDGDGTPNASDRCPGFDDSVDGDDDGLPDGCDPDVDGDGVANGSDNCLDKPNAAQADLDQDGVGDACDPDIDGDGFSNGSERAKGTDPYDPRSRPGVVGVTRPI